MLYGLSSNGNISWCSISVDSAKRFIYVWNKVDSIFIDPLFIKSLQTWILWVEFKCIRILPHNSIGKETILFYNIKKMLVALLFLTSFLNFKNFQGVLETCSGWRLNRYPVLKKFIKGPDGAKLYDKLKISFVPGHNPDLITTKPLKRTDLTTYSSIGDLHELLISKGFFPKNESKHKLCLFWIEYKICKKFKTKVESICNIKCPRNELWNYKKKSYERLIIN